MHTSMQQQAKSFYIFLRAPVLVIYSASYHILSFYHSDKHKNQQLQEDLSSRSQLLR